MVSAYRITFAFTFRAARPIIWIIDVSLRRNPGLVRVEDRHQRHLGQIEPFAQQVHADQHVKIALPQVLENFHALERLDLAVQIPAAEARLLDVGATDPPPAAW